MDWQVRLERVTANSFSTSFALIDPGGLLVDWDAGLPLEFAAVASGLKQGGVWRDIVARARDQEGFDRTGAAPALVTTCDAVPAGPAPLGTRVRRDYVYRAAERLIHVTESPLVGGHWSRSARDVTPEPTRAVSPGVAPGPGPVSGMAAPQHTILIVDDHDLVRSAVAKNLRALNYRVLSAAGAAAAIDLLRSDERIDLLFTDVVMPGGIGGVELAREARALRPDIKLLFASGLGAIPTDQSGALAQEVELLMKPYDLPQLLDTLRRMMVA
jgi:CheY-like chemotaxis protein